MLQTYVEIHTKTRTMKLEILIMKALGRQYYLVKRFPFLAKIIQKINRVEIFVYPDADTFDYKRYVVKKNGNIIGEC